MRRFILMSFLVFPVFANEQPPEPETEAVTDLPELPLPVHSGETMEPDITIVRKGTNTVEEYRRSGKLYMIKVKPDIGPPYYFLDNDGDGKMDVRTNDLDKGSNINMWKLWEW